jgi:hypothetical protein
VRLANVRNIQASNSNNGEFTMCKRTTFCSVVLLLTVPAWSQQNLKSDQGQNVPSAERVPRRIEGCLGFNGVSYVLAVVSNGPKQYRVVGGNVERLRGELGHTVEIEGMTAPNDAREMAMNWDIREATTGVGWYNITAEQVRNITSNCSYPGFEKPLSHVGEN